MWKSIKNFFKRIADCTGISWIFGKISSCWRSCWSHSQEEDFVIIDMSELTNKPSHVKPELTNEPSHVEPEPKPEPVIAGIFVDKDELVLFVERNNTGKVFGGGVGIANNAELSYAEILNKLGYCAYVKCERDGGIFKITCDKLIKDNNNNGAFLSIKSVASQDGKTLSSKLEGMKNMLDLSEKQAVVGITQISKNPIITVPEVVANNNTPSSETTNVETEQFASSCQRA